MMAHVYGFDWGIYAKRVMPAFARWLIDGDETNVYELYRQTRCAQEERLMPHALQQLQTWPRAQAFVKQLPRGLNAHSEYQKLCDAEHFTALSDQYFHRHPPQLYQNAAPLRVIWGAIVEEYCISWFHTPYNAPEPIEGRKPAEAAPDEQDEQEADRSELISLLHSAGLNELAQAATEAFTTEPIDEEHDTEAATEGGEALVLDEKEFPVAPVGVMIGRPPSTLHMRGWLATISVRAMALFELLAFGRRCMPFGYRADEPFEAYIGYLTPEEVWQLALCLRNVQPPNQAEAKEQYMRFRRQRASHSDTFSMIDEVLPSHADAFVKVVRAVAPQGLGLICSVE